MPRNRGPRTAPRAVTLPAHRRLSGRQRPIARTLGEAILEDLAASTEPRPRTRAECRDGPRPCPWVGCKWHLYLDVNPATGALKLNFPDRELDELVQTCALDVAERGEHVLETVGELTNLTRERVRLTEVRALLKLRGVFDAGSDDSEAG